MDKIKTNFHEIDEVLNSGGQEGKLIAVASRPGMGKTTLCLKMMSNITSETGANILFFSLEKSKEKVTEILFGKWNLSADNLSKIHIEEKADITAEYIEEKILKSPNISVVFIDGIALIKDFNSNSQNEILSKLRNICKTQNISIIYTCNHKRKSENQITERPVLSDFDEHIQKNTDAIFAFYRSAYYIGNDTAANFRNSKHFSGELIKIPLESKEKSLQEYYYPDFPFDDASQKRVELSVHTKLSDDVSTISVSDAFDFALFCGHKAIAFTNSGNVQDFPEIAKYAKEKRDIKVIYGARVFYEKNGCGAPAMTLLVKNQSGLKDLYKIISSDLEDLPVVDIKTIEKYRKHLLCSACGDLSELFLAFESDESYGKIMALAQNYDYIEIFPSNDILTREIYKKMFELGKELNIPVVATGDCHYYSKDDEICRRVVKEFKGGSDDNDQQYLRNTEEMLDAFAYLGQENAYEVVVKNSNLIADLIEKVEPLSSVFYEFNIPHAEECITKQVTEKVVSLYGKTPSSVVAQRVEEELESIKNNYFYSYYMLAHLIAKYAHENKIPTCSRGGVGGSFVAYLLGITNVNPLPPHYYCSKCAFTEFIDGEDICSGYDLEEKNCPICGGKLVRDGNNIPFESFSGEKGDMVPNIGLSVPPSFKDKVLEYLCELFGEERLVLAGAIQKLTPNVAERYVNMYKEKYNKDFDKDLESSISSSIEDVKRKETLHPAGVFILPEGKEACDFTPTQKVDENSPIKRKTHFDFFRLHDNIFKTDIMGYAPLEILVLLEKYTGISAKDINIHDAKIYELFKDSSVLGLSSDEPAVLGLSEFETEVLRNIIKQTKPKNFNELVKISGLAHGTNTWFGNAEELIKNKVCNLSDLPATREDVYNQLLKFGIKRSLAFKIMQGVRKGKFLREILKKDPEILQEFTSKNIPEWYIDYFCKIKYLFPKAYATEYVKIALSIAWYKIYYPVEFYTAILNVRYPDEKFQFIFKGKGAIEDYIKRTYDYLIEEKGLVQFYKNDMAIDPKFRLLLECAERGIEFKINEPREY